MATLSSHTLNGVDGTHAGGIGIDLYRLTADIEPRRRVYAGQTDEGGRLSTELDLIDAVPGDRYELVFTTGAYWAGRGMAGDARQILSEIVIRFAMPDLSKRYHIPVILSPHTYSVWLSG